MQTTMIRAFIPQITTKLSLILPIRPHPFYVAHRHFREWRRDRQKKKKNVVTVDPQARIIQRVSSVLDDNFVRTDRSKPVRERGKLSQPLIKLPEKKSKLSEESVQDGGTVELQEVLNAELETSQFADFLPGVEDLSLYIELNKVSVNQDISHVHVEWTSTPLFEFYCKLYDSAADVPKGGKPPYTLNDVEKFEHKIDQLNQMLQAKEAVFRTAMVRAGYNFRRVPRIYFRVEPDMKAMLKDLRHVLIHGHIGDFKETGW